MGVWHALALIRYLNVEILFATLAQAEESLLERLFQCLQNACHSIESDTHADDAMREALRRGAGAGLCDRHCEILRVII